MAYWIKILYERNTYVVDLDSLSTFCIETSQRVKFWIPDNSQLIVIHPQTHPDVYQQVIEYIKMVTTQMSSKYWVTIHYERHQYVIDLNQINTFICDTGKRLKFWLPDSQTPIIINPHSNPDDYQKLQTYISQTTGYSLP